VVQSDTATEPYARRWPYATASCWLCCDHEGASTEPAVPARGAMTAFFLARSRLYGESR
jgi:hypothetical protein